MFSDHVMTFTKILGDNHHVFYPTAYATAWVARVPDQNDIRIPAFPSSVRWIEANQNQDGSWGQIFPLNSYSNTLSTFSAILALKQWNHSNNQRKINEGIQALLQLSERLEKKGDKTFGFELLLAALVEDCEMNAIRLPEELFISYKPFLNAGNEQRQQLQNFLEQTEFKNPNIFWLCLESLGFRYLKNSKKSWPVTNKQLNNNGSLLSSVPTTAYSLAASRERDKDLPLSYQFLNKVIQHDQGGAVPYHPMEQYELAFSLDYLLKGGIPVEWVHSGIERLKQQWQLRNGLGYSSLSPSLDADDTALGLIVLRSAGYDVHFQPLIDFFNGNYFSYSQEDPSPSLSVNANIIRALRFFENDKTSHDYIQKTVHWIKKELDKSFENALFDSWHCSPFYTGSALVFATHSLDDDIVKTCAEWMVNQQNEDGGWGYYNKSTDEETALVLLALLHIDPCQTKYHDVLANGKKYLLKRGNEILSLYKGSTIVCPKNVVKATILGAIYALNQ